MSTERDTHMFLAGWNGCQHRKSASDEFKAAVASAPGYSPAGDAIPDSAQMAKTRISHQQRTALMEAAVRSVAADDGEVIVWSHHGKQVEMSNLAFHRYTTRLLEMVAAPSIGSAPVAYIQADHLQKAKQAPFLCRVEPTQRLPDFVPLFDAPAARAADPTPQVCQFVESWRGKCTAQAGTSGFCLTHTVACCSCGKPATHDCDHTGQFVCGAPLCNDCEGKTEPRQSSGVWGFGNHSHGPKSAVPTPETPVK